MGKMSQADFDEMSGRLRRRAVGLIRQLDAGGGYREAIEQEVERRLSEGGDKPLGLSGCECGTTNDPDAKFCKNCGARL